MLKLQELTPEAMPYRRARGWDRRVYLKALANPQAFYLPANSAQFIPAPSSCTKTVVQ